MRRIHVIGAGPSGSIAAICAIRSGADAVISEEHPQAGLPENCSGLFSIDGLSALQPFVDRKKIMLKPIHGAIIDFCGERITVRRKEPVAYVCDRSKMDRLLCEKAEDTGAKINFNERIRDSFHSQDIIAADGPLSGAARHFGFPKIRGFAATLQARFKHRCERTDMVELFFSNSRFPGFFAWVIPRSEDEAEFGVGVEVPARAGEAWNRLLRMKRISDAPKPKGAVIPLEARPQSAKRIGARNVLLVGDAAGQVKSTTGGGVIFGAGCAAIAGIRSDDPLRYELEWRMRYGADLAMHSWLHNHLAGLDDRGMASLGRKLKKLNIDDYLSERGHMDKPTNMMGPDLMAHILKNFAEIF